MDRALDLILMRKDAPLRVVHLREAEPTGGNPLSVVGTFLCDRPT
jgi:hypothetical protein